MKVLGTLIRPHYKASPSEHGGCSVITQLRKGVHELTWLLISSISTVSTDTPPATRDMPAFHDDINSGHG